MRAVNDDLLNAARRLVEKGRSVFGISSGKIPYANCSDCKTKSDAAHRALGDCLRLVADATASGQPPGTLPVLSSGYRKRRRWVWPYLPVRLRVSSLWSTTQRMAARIPLTV